MSWDTEPAEDRDLVERGAVLLQRLALAVFAVCVAGMVMCAGGVP